MTPRLLTAQRESSSQTAIQSMSPQQIGSYPILPFDRNNRGATKLLHCFIQTS
jgi:hypothetical protein